MFETDTAPRLAGYQLVARHACPRCGGLVRALYRRIPDTAAEPERHIAGFSQRRFTRGAIITSSDHADPGHVRYAYQASSGCGYVLPAITTASPESFIQQLFDRLAFAPTYRDEARQDERVVSFDLDRLLSQPWVAWATASDPAEPPLLMLPNAFLLRHILVRGNVPAPRTPIADLTVEEKARLAPAFLEAIGGVSQPRQF